VSAAVTLLYPSIQAVPAPAWSGLVTAERGFLGADYLRALERAAPARLGFRYAVLDGTEAPLAVAALQMLEGTARECVPALGKCHATEPGWRRCLRRAALSTLGARRLRVLLCGNVFAGGEPGLAWRSPRDSVRAFQAAAAAMERWPDIQTRPAVRVFKDVGERHLSAARQALQPLGYREVPADPVMVLPIQPGWRRFADYLGALKARYRGHVRQALRASASVERRLLDASDIAAAAVRIDELHAGVIARAAITPSWIDARGFSSLRESLGQRFAFIGYYAEGTLVGFNTRFLFGDEMESHYCGLDYQVSKRYALYRSMLYDDIAAAIGAGVRRLSFGRTSHEIKSSLGAVARPMAWFGKAQAPLLTGLLAHLMRGLVPPWVAHQPFRDHS
jgi:hypothetical protein